MKKTVVTHQIVVDCTTIDMIAAIASPHSAARGVTILIELGAMHTTTVVVTDIAHDAIDLVVQTLAIGRRIRRALRRRIPRNDALTHAAKKTDRHVAPLAIKHSQIIIQQSHHN